MAAITAKGLEKLIKESIPARTALGGGLYLTITKGGSTSFGFRYNSGKNDNGNPRKRLIGLGAFCPSNNTLAMARNKAIKLKGMINQGIDPIEQSIQERNRALAAEKANKIAEERNQATFNKVALEFIESKKAEWKSAKHHQQWVNTLTTYAFRIIGHIPVADIETAHVLAILKPIWNTKTETATRVRTRLEAVLSYAEAHNWRTGGNPARWRGHLSAILPSPQNLKN